MRMALSAIQNYIQPEHTVCSTGGRKKNFLLKSVRNRSDCASCFMGFFLKLRSKNNLPKTDFKYSN